MLRLPWEAQAAERSDESGNSVERWTTMLSYLQGTVNYVWDYLLAGRDPGAHSSVLSQCWRCPVR
eukprot:9489177-Pyramimonas_sp.AAC.1